MPKTALGGIKVLELCQLVAGPYCTKLLADLGAEVIKIEPPGCGDRARHLPPFLHDSPDPESSGLFLYLNTNKLGITLNVETATGRDIFHKLVEEADILVEDRAPGAMKQLELDYENLKEINPRLIMASITLFGQTGPYRDYKSYPLNVFNAGGEGYLTPGGIENLERPPLKVGNLAGEYDSGLNAAIAILGVLYRRKKSGCGQYIDVSKQEAIMALNRLDMPRWANEGDIITRARLGVPYGGALPCEDGYTVFITWEADQWDKLVKFMGNPEWASDDQFKDYESRYKNGELINALLTEWMTDHTKEELYHRGQAAGVPFAMVYDSKDLVESEQLEARGFFIDVDHPKTGKLKYPTAPYKFSETPWGVERPAPLLGEHNEEVVVDRLGFSKQALVKLGEAGVI
jgi:crotonobetainyl-CoA:carnitine CoA-transferase CaiB-like acyl-CoA transferase